MCNKKSKYHFRFAMKVLTRFLYTTVMMDENNWTFYAKDHSFFEFALVTLCLCASWLKIVYFLCHQDTGPQRSHKVCVDSMFKINKLTLLHSPLFIFIRSPDDINKNWWFDFPKNWFFKMVKLKPIRRKTVLL
jgi:hypothetical protein